MDATLHHTPNPGGHLSTSLVLFSTGFGTLFLEGLHYLPSVVMALGAFTGGVASLLPAVSNFLDRRQARRHAAEEFRRRQRMV